MHGALSRRLASLLPAGPAGTQVVLGVLGCPNLPQAPISEADCDEGQAGRSFSDEGVGTMFAAAKGQVGLCAWAIPLRLPPLCLRDTLDGVGSKQGQSGSALAGLPLPPAARPPLGACHPPTPQGTWAGPVFGGVPGERVFCNDVQPLGEVRYMESWEARHSNHGLAQAIAGAPPGLRGEWVVLVSVV